MRSLGVKQVVTFLFCLFLSVSIWAKSLPDNVTNLHSLDGQTQARAAKVILNSPGEVPVIAVEHATVIAGRQLLLDTKPSLIVILQETSNRGTTRALAADSLGLMARATPDNPENSDIFTFLILASYDKNWNVRLSVCRALANTGNMDAAFRLTELFYSDPDPRVQLFAGNAFYQLTGSYPETSSSSSQTPESIQQRILNYINIHIRLVK